MDLDIDSSIGVNLRVTAHSNQGGRKYMEDMLSVAYQPTVDEKDLLYAYFGIFDGHGGREAAAYTKDHLMDSIVSQKNFWSTDDESVLKAIRDGFVNTHYAMRKELDQWPKTIYGLPSTSGTTASVAFVRRNKLYIGHVGDSAIVLGYQDVQSGYWRAKPLTREHKPESIDENARITQCGGKVIRKSGVPRVVWNRPRLGHKGPVRRSTPIDEIPFLAVARSLGDFWSYNSDQNQFVVSPEPDVTVVDIDVANFRCLIFASDGLWNMLNAQEAVNSVYFAEKNNERQLLASPPETVSSQVKNWINPSRRLVDRALDRWYQHSLRADNTSVVTVVIDPPGPPKSQVLRRREKYLNHILRNSPEPSQDERQKAITIKSTKTQGTPVNTTGPPAIFHNANNVKTSPSGSGNRSTVAVSSKRSAVGAAQKKFAVENGGGQCLPSVSKPVSNLSPLIPPTTGLISELRKKKLSAPQKFSLKPPVVISGVKRMSPDTKPPVFTERRRDRIQAQAASSPSSPITVQKLSDESTKKLNQPAATVTSSSTKEVADSQSTDTLQKRPSKRKLESTESSGSSDEIDPKKVTICMDIEGPVRILMHAVQIHEVSSSNELGIASAPDEGAATSQPRKKSGPKTPKAKELKPGKATSSERKRTPAPPTPAVVFSSPLASSSRRTRQSAPLPSTAVRMLRSDTAKKAKEKVVTVASRVTRSMRKTRP